MMSFSVASPPSPQTTVARAEQFGQVPAVTKTRAVDAPAGGLEGLLRAASSRAGLAMMDLSGRFTVLTWSAGPAFSWRVEDGGSWLPGARQLSGHGPAGGPPLPGGVVGWLGYEAGAACDRMPTPAAARDLPDVCLWRVEGAIIHDRQTMGWSVNGTSAFHEQAQRVLSQASRSRSDGPRVGANPTRSSQTPPGGQAARYQTAVRRALERIAAGEVYQVNLAWPLDLPPVADPIGAWLELRQANPAREGALLRHPDGWVLGNSPECYLHIERAGEGLQVRSVPIKGTAPREGGKAAVAMLRSSPKERAELTMIVDLVRNDLGRIAAPGSVRAEARALRVCGDLWHAEQVVRATTRPGLDAWDVVAASFPPGSVTGAPKVAAMNVIAELEGRPRGLYTGAIVALGDNGEGWLSVVIRTATISEQGAQVFVGAGIVADSDPEAEWRETLAKARALTAVLGRTS